MHIFTTGRGKKYQMLGVVKMIVILRATAIFLRWYLDVYVMILPKI